MKFCCLVSPLISGSFAFGFITSPFMILKQSVLGIKGVIVNTFKGKLVTALLFFWGIFKNIAISFFNYSKALFGPLFKFLIGGLKNVGNVILNLPRLIGIAFNAIKGLWTALNATNPVGWIILAVTAVVVVIILLNSVPALLTKTEEAGEKSEKK